MELVIDANVFIAALISPHGHTACLFFLDFLRLYAPEFLLDELEKHKEEISAKAGLSEEDFRRASAILEARVKFVSLTELIVFFPSAKRISPDPDDMAYFALALKLCCPLWSNDGQLKSQPEVKVFSTSELIQFLS